MDTEPERPRRRKKTMKKDPIRKLEAVLLVIVALVTILFLAHVVYRGVEAASLVEEKN